MPAILNEFRAFVVRGNVVDLAVGVVVGAAFTAVVNALVRDLITPLIAAPEYLSQIPMAATRCAFCTTEVPPLAAA